MSTTTTQRPEKKRLDLRGNIHPESYTGTSPIKVKKLGHLVYQVSDLERSVRFWTQVMGFKETERNSLGMVFLRCNSDHHAIGLVPCPGGERPAHDAGMAIEHLAMEVESLESLVAMREYLIANGIPIRFEGRKGAGCNYSINFLDPDGYEFEIYTRMDQIDETGRLRPKSQFRPASSLAEAIANPVPERW